MSEDRDRDVFNFDRDLAGFSPRQLAAIKTLDAGVTKFLLYGGALGGGKSYFIRWYSVRFLMDIFMEFGMRYVTTMIACEDYPSLKDRQLQKVSQEFPPWLGKLYSDHAEYGRSFILDAEYGNGVICFRNLDDASKYASSEFALICVDELTKNTYDTFTHLRTRLRWPGLDDLKCQFVGGTNPGGVGHGWCKQLFISKVYPEEFIYPKDYRNSFAFVPSKADDNPYLDASYWAMLNTLPAHLRGAFRDGNWDVFAGQAFQEWSPPYHVIKPIPIPEGAPIIMTYDWGFGKPFSIGWWFVDSEGRVVRFREWYGWNGTADVGLRLADSAVAKGIKDREIEWGIWGKVQTRWAGRDCFNKKPNTQGGGQLPSTAEEFIRYDKELKLRPADADRQMKIKQFRERLRVKLPDYKAIARTFEWFESSGQWIDTDGNIHSQAELESKAIEMGIDVNPDRPMLQVFDTCVHFIRTIPDLPEDENNIEDVDTKAEDHVYDEACHICITRPLIIDEETQRKMDIARSRKEREATLNSVSRAAYRELIHLKDQIEMENEFEYY